MNTYAGMIKFNQQGSSLIVSLLILLVMTLIGVSAMSTSSLEEKMARNIRDSELAFQATEAAVLQGENFTDNNVVNVGVAFNGTTAYLYPLATNVDIYADATWDTAKTYDGTINGIKTAPKYIIEYIGEVTLDNPDLGAGLGYAGDASTVVSLFRITARGTGGTDNTVTMIQAYHGV